MVQSKTKKTVKDEKDKTKKTKTTASEKKEPKAKKPAKTDVAKPKTKPAEKKVSVKNKAESKVKSAAPKKQSKGEAAPKKVSVKKDDAEIKKAKEAEEAKLANQRRIVEEAKKAAAAKKAEAARKAAEAAEAEKKIKEEEARKVAQAAAAALEAERKVKEEARKAAEAKAEEIKKIKAEAERKALEEAKAKEDAEELERLAKEEEEKKAKAAQAAQDAPKYTGKITINELVTVKLLAEKMNVKPVDVLKKLMSMGILATINHRLDTDTAILLAGELGFEAVFESMDGVNTDESEQEDSPENLVQRAPIVTIMGHVDHGKTSLLDAVRDSSIAAGEHGGITQHIGAYRVKSSSGDITFLDTPGHEAFTAMRSRGAQATDIVILVVSATDGVQPQTIEAINHAKAAAVPIIVAVNKIDLPGARPDNIRTELAQYGLNPEEWGGDTMMVDVSAKQRLNIDDLLERVLLQAEVMELKANPKKKASGVVVEAKLDSKKGPVATLLVQNGTLHVGDNIVVGTTYGKVRAMADDKGKRFTEATPSMPAEILGLNEPPQAGDRFVVVNHESEAREIADSRKEKVKADSLRPRQHLSLLDISSGKVKDLRIVLKTDVQGSLGALCDALERMSNNEINLRIIHKGAGGITESDVALAAASDALIVGFNIRPDAVVEKLAETEGVSINVYRIIYELIADVKAAMEGLLDPDMKEKILGKAVVKQVFKLSSSGTISGCQVSEGKAVRGSKARLLRDNVIVFEGSISSLKRFKEDVKEVEKGYECGIGLENFSDVKVGDIIEFFAIEKTARKLAE
jgi:translation initiation factor IF-2